MFKTKYCITLLCLGFMIGGLETAQAAARDEVKLLTQRAAIRGRITPGDLPGFPVTITAFGTYRLGSNLVVPGANDTAIHVLAANVTIDLNGFTITTVANQPVAGSGFGINATLSSPTACGPGSINSFAQHLTIRNGSIQFMGQDGVCMGQGKLDGVLARGNGRIGLNVNASAVITNCQVYSNLFDGLGAGSPPDDLNGGMTILNNIADGNARHGMVIGPGSAIVANNTSVGNVGTGLIMSNTSGYVNNVLDANGTNVSGGIQLGANICGAALCP